MLPGTPPDLEAEAESLAEKVQAGTSSGSQASVASLGLAESCPACHTQISLTDIATATCPNGHIWRESSSSLSPLSPPTIHHPHISIPIHSYPPCSCAPNISPSRHTPRASLACSFTNTTLMRVFLFPPYSTVLHYVLHTLDAHGPHVYVVLSQGVPPSPATPAPSCPSGG